MGRSRVGLTTKIHARVDAKGRPVCLLISPGEVHDVTCAETLLAGLEQRAIVIADKGYDAEAFACISGLKGPSPTFRTAPTAKRSTDGRRPSIASATTSNASSTSSSSSAGLPPDTTSSALPSLLSSSLQPCEFGCAQLSPRPSNPHRSGRWSGLMSVSARQIADLIRP